MANQQAVVSAAAESGQSTYARKGLNGDAVFKGITTFFAVVILIVAVGMVLTLVINSRDAISGQGFSFFTSDTWDPNVKQVFGARPFIFGTLVTSLLALTLAALVGIGIALLLVELQLPRWFSTPVAFLVELLAAIPSIVYGTWGIFVLIPLMQAHIDPFLHSILGWTPFFAIDASGGRSILTASLVIAVMIVPTVAAISRDVIRVVPNDQREAMLALGATRWEMIWGAVLPFARPGIIGALILALGRAVGETIAATMVIGNASYVGGNLFNSADTLASRIANELSEASGRHLAALFELGLTLLFISVLLNVLARLLVWSVSRGSAQVA